jgi:hypothetical protein
MKFTGKDDIALSDIKHIFLKGLMSKLVHSELEVHLAAREKEMVREETLELVAENHEKYDGSPVGFFYQGQLFAVGPAFKEPDIKPIHTALEDKAAFLKENRMDIPQYMTYFAHFLSALDTYCEENPVAYVVNMPKNLSSFSPSLSKLENFVNEQAEDELEASTFKRDDPSKKTFFQHYDKIDGPIKRFTFRRITL